MERGRLPFHMLTRATNRRPRSMQSRAVSLAGDHVVCLAGALLPYTNTSLYLSLLCPSCGGFLCVCVCGSPVLAIFGEAKMFLLLGARGRTTAADPKPLPANARESDTRRRTRSPFPLGENPQPCPLPTRPCLLPSGGAWNLSLLPVLHLSVTKLNISRKHRQNASTAGMTNAQPTLDRAGGG